MCCSGNVPYLTDLLYSIGLSACHAFGLYEDESLPILRTANKEECIRYAGAWAYKRYEDKSQSIRELYTSAAMAVIGCGLVAKVGTAPDGYWHQVSTKDPTVRHLPPARLLDSISIETAIRVVVATKANWWITHEQVESSELPTNLSQIARRLFRQPDGQDVTDCFNTIGKWASTIRVLHLAGIRDIRPTTPVIGQCFPFTLTRDEYHWFSFLPAGTRRCDIGYQATKLLVRSQIAWIFEGLPELIIFKIQRDQIAQSRSRFHVSAEYLTGAPRIKYNDRGFENYLGRLGLFMREIHPDCPVSRSVHFANERVLAYPDYSERFHNLLRAYKILNETASQEEFVNFMDTYTIRPDDEVDMFAAAFQ